MSGLPTLVLLDDGINDGGGQLGLARYLEQGSSFCRRLLLLAPNAIEQRVQALVPMRVVQPTRSRSGLARAWRWLLRDHLGSRGTDVVLANSFMAALVLAATPKRGRTFVYYLREDLSYEWISGWRRFIATRFALRRFDGFLANSLWTLETLPSSLRDRPAAVAAPLSGIRDVQRLEADDGPALRILSLSRITPWKGVDVAVDAVCRLAAQVEMPIILTIAGRVSPADRAYLDEMLARASGGPADIRYLGHVDEIDELLATHDVLVVSSRHPEPFGQVVVQGLAAGLSVVATDQGGPRELLAAEPFGHLIPPDDAPALAAVLAEIALDPPSAEARRASARRTLEAYADGRLAVAFDSALTSVVDEVRRSSPAASRARSR